MKSIKVRVPGKILLVGEYAVLDGFSSLSLAVDRYLQVSMELKESGGWQLHSDLWSAPKNLATASSADIQSEALLQVAAFAQKHFSLPHIRCHIQSDLDLRFGLGSSTALRLGVLLGAEALARQTTDISAGSRLESAALVYRMQKELQSFASGYDVLTQATGGLLLWKPDYQNWPGTSLQPLDSRHLSSHLAILVGGQGAPTAKVGGSVRQALADSSLKEAYFAASERLLQSFVKFLEEGATALPNLCHDVAQHRRIFASLPHFPTKIFAALQSLPGFDHSWTAKTTGAGGEDALLLIGPKDQTQKALIALEVLGWHPLPVQATDHGASFDFGIEP